MQELYTKYRSLKEKIADLENIIGVLSWDQEVNMPVTGAAFRAQQIATLSGIVHETTTNGQLEDLLDELSETNGLDFTQQRNIAESLRSVRKKKKLSRAFIEKQSKAISEAYQAWIQARAEDNFLTFAPKLGEIIALQREKAELLGYEDHPYDAMLDDYEPALKTSRVEQIFTHMHKDLSHLMDQLKGQQEPDTSFFNNTFDKEKQLALCKELITSLGYSLESGRLDLSEHPFSISFNPLDARITTRVNTHDLRESVWGAIHETGHALYEMGLKSSEYGLPSGSPVSLSIHESQSRLWENNVGKSQEFVNAFWPVFQNFFPHAFENVSAEKFFKGLNHVTPDLIRINSDEVTYHFHVLLRFEIEKGILDGTYQVHDLEEVWNSKIKDYLGLQVPGAKDGVLQDIHWSHGSFGYFPTYSLGSFYAAQFFHAAQQAIPDLEEQIAGRQYTALLQWLRSNIHQYGHIYSSEELCEKITGEPLNYKYFHEYIYNKFRKIYTLEKVVS